MKKITLKQAIKRHVEQIELPQDKLDNLMDIQNSAIEEQYSRTENNKSFSSYTKLYAFAATILIALSLGYFLTTFDTPIDKSIATEVANNHLKLKPLEVKSNQLSTLDQYFTQLDFKLVNTSILHDPKWTLLGARYCSIQGHTAAQLRLQNNITGALETLYQAPYHEDQFSSLPIAENKEPPVEEFAKGISVKVWVEKGVLFAFTNSKIGD